MLRALALAHLTVLVAGTASGAPEGEGFGQQTWVARCAPDATNGMCMPDVTAANFLDPENGGGDALSDLSSGPDHHPYASYPFRSNDGLRSAESTYVAKYRGRQHSPAGVPGAADPGAATAESIYGRGGTNQGPTGQDAATGGADGGYNNFNQGGSFTTLDTMFQRPTASFGGSPDSFPVVTAGATDYSGFEHGLFRCTADTNTAWSASQIEIDSVKYNPPLQGRHRRWPRALVFVAQQNASLLTVGAVFAGGSARFMMQTSDFAAGTNCEMGP